MVIDCQNILTILLPIIVWRFSDGSSIINDITVKYQEKWFMDSHILRIKPNVGPKRCVLDCARHVGCGVVNYKRDRLFCELLKSSPGDRLITFKPYSVSQKKNWIIPDDPCSRRICRDETYCVIAYNGLPFCIKIAQKLTKKEKIQLELIRRDFYLTEVGSYNYVSQSSTFSAGGIAYPASNAVDGDLSSVAITNDETQPYWIVDFGRVFTVACVIVINRGDCCGHRLHNLDILLGITFKNTELCEHYPGPGETGQHLTFTCYQTGQYVKLSIRHTGGTELLQLAEVKIWTV